MRISLVLSALLAGTAFFIGCGSSSSGDTLTKGYLVDSPIAGVHYSCGDITGTTLSTGEFSCKTVPVTFKIGGLTLGTISAFTADKKVYPQDLVGVPRTNFSDEKVIGLTRLLQSLDDDGNITDAITIPSGVASKFAADTVGSDWATLAGIAGVTLVDAEEAMGHLRDNLNPTTDNSGDGGSSDNSSWVPVSNNFTCNPAPMTLQGRTLDMRFAAEGDISVSCVTAGTMTVGQYALGVDSLNITQLIKEDRYEGTSPRGSFLGIETHDYQAGTIHIVHSGAETLDCVETYTSILPETIDSVSKLESIMEYSPSRDMLTNTTCPNSYYADDGGGEDSGDVGTGTGINRTNYTFTDSTGKTHLISTEVKSTN